MRQRYFIKLALLAAFCFTWHLSSIAQRSFSREDEVSLFLDNLFSATDVMVSDVASPTGAARFYAYLLLGAYVVQSDLAPDQINSGLYKGFVSPFKLIPATLPAKK